MHLCRGWAPLRTSDQSLLAYSSQVWCVQQFKIECFYRPASAGLTKELIPPCEDYTLPQKYGYGLVRFLSMLDFFLLMHRLRPTSSKDRALRYVEPMSCSVTTVTGLFAAIRTIYRRDERRRPVLDEQDRKIPASHRVFSRQGYMGDLLAGGLSPERASQTHSFNSQTSKSKICATSYANCSLKVLLATIMQL